MQPEKAVDFTINHSRLHIAQNGRLLVTTNEGKLIYKNLKILIVYYHCQYLKKLHENYV